jgi:hypothetical protein
MAVVQGSVYANTTGFLVKINPVTGIGTNVNQTSNSFWSSALFMAPREWMVNVHGCGANQTTGCL